MTKEKTPLLFLPTSWRRGGPLLIVILVVAALTLWGWLRLSPPAAPPVPPVGTVKALPEHELLIYFATPAGRLSGEPRLLPQDVSDSVNLRAVVAALIDGPVTPELSRVLPESARLLQLELHESVAILDFSREFIAAHPGGSVSELLTVYALVDSLAVNFPYVRQIHILVEGDEVETIKGHVDLRRPIAVDFSYVENSADGVSTDAVGELIEKHGGGETR